MKVLLVHNRYRTSAPSGEDFAVDNERRMLATRGVEVAVFERCNDDLDESSLAKRAAIAVDAVWSQRSRTGIAQVLKSARPDIVHVHNTFAMLSPSIYGAIRSAGVPVVQTLHNFRFFCPGALLLREGKPCEDCLDKNLLQSLRYRCYRGSLLATATLAATLTVHRGLGTYTHHIDRYITPTRFGRGKAIKGGIDERKIVVKPHFIPKPPPVGRGGGNYVVFVGRLLEGKGAETLVAAWRQLPTVKLKIIGEGALRPQLQDMARREQLNIEFAGRQDRTAVLDAIGAADFLVMPSECYEAFGLVIAEAFACGTPVLASRIGSMDELVEEGVTGRKFKAGDPQDLARAVRTLLADEPALRRMRANARAQFEANFTEEQNFSQLMQIYADVIAGREQVSSERAAASATPPQGLRDAV